MWLADFQRQFGEVLRTPLGRETLSLRANTSAYDAALCRQIDAAQPTERLAVYNRQYWFRLFGVFHGEFPTVTKLLGAWTVNGLVNDFLLAHPPRGWDLGEAADGFVEHVESLRVSSVPLQALQQAAHIDEAFRAVRRAPPQPRFVPTQEDAPRLASSRLVRSRATRIVDEDWPLLALRRGSAELGPQHAATRSFVICRYDRGERVVPLEQQEARLFRLLDEKCLEDALANLDEGLAGAVQRWFARGIELGLWTGMEL